jgi:hypothetical protein
MSCPALFMSNFIHHSHVLDAYDEQAVNAVVPALTLGILKA